MKGTEDLLNMLKKTAEVCFFCVIAVNCFAFNNYIHAQAPEASVQQRFFDALSDYESGKYREAAMAFSQLAAEKPIHAWSAVSKVMEGQAFYRSKDYHAALGVLQNFSRRFHDSKYTAYVHYLRGNAFYRLDEMPSAFREYVIVCEIAQEQELLNRAANKAANIFSQDISLDYLDKLAQRVRNEVSQDIVQIKRAEKHVRQERLGRAQEILKPLLRKSPPRLYTEQARKLENYIEAIYDQPLVIGVILSISSAADDQGRQFFNGLKLAIDEYNKKSKKHISLAFRNAENSSLKAVAAVRLLSQYPQVAAIVGPLESEMAIASAAAIEVGKAGVSFLVPAAQDAGIAALNPWVFQMVSDYAAEGKKIAEFAVKDLQLTTFATFSPITISAQELTKNFIETVLKLNGKVLDQELYYPGTIKFDRQFTNLRKKCWEFKLEMHQEAAPLTDVLDSLEAAYFGKRQIPEGIQTEVPAPVDTSLDIPITSLDGLYLPIQEEDIKYIAPKIALFNFRAQLLGASDWNNVTSLVNQEIYINGVCFTTKNTIKEYSLPYVNFRNLFRQRMYTTPGPMEVRGYDCGNLLKACVERKAYSREAFRKALASTKNFQGLTGTIQFDAVGSNQWVPIAQYKDGVITYNQEDIVRQSRLDDSNDNRRKIH